MIFVKEDIRANGALVLTFNEMSLSDIVNFAHAFKSVLKAEQVRHPDGEIAVGLEANSEVGKTTICSEMLGVDLKQQKERAQVSLIDWKSGFFGNSRVMVSDFNGLGTVVWMDSLGIFTDGIDDASYVELESNNSQYHRHKFQRAYKSYNNGGISLIEWPEYHKGSAEISYLIDLKKAWDDYYEPRSNPAPREMDLTIMPQAHRSQELEVFLNNIRHTASPLSAVT